MDLIVKKELIDEINQLEIKQEEDFDRGPTMHFTSFPPSATMKSINSCMTRMDSRPSYDQSQSLLNLTIWADSRHSASNYEILATLMSKVPLDSSSFATMLRASLLRWLLVALFL
ncbi:hypothetical protein M3Y98_00818600 [Aphelenchoides besseyi]|nr:hypothetical protein M3Y98_00818600 [Aphelenchoides besseyi]